jgi:monoamine oxidase
VPAQFDVLIVGAGAAGLAAARDLSGAGKRVFIAEARHRIGGRIHTLHLSDLPLPVELGAEFIHGEAETSFAIVEAAALHVYQLPDNHWMVRNGAWEIIEDFWARMNRVRARIRPAKRDRSFADFLKSQKLDPRTRELARNYVEGYHAAHADRMSSQALTTSDEEQEDPGGNKQFRIASGYDSLLAWLRSGLDPSRSSLLLGTTVTSIGWSKSGVSATCRTGKQERTIRARRALITIPIGVWKAPAEQEGAIRFDPQLTSKQNALDTIEVGHVVKIAFHFRERFWDDDDFLESRIRKQDRQQHTPLNFVHSDNRFMPTWWTMAPARAPILTGWAGGHAADALLAEGSASMVDRALDSMAETFGVRRRQLDSQLIATHSHNWQADPFSRGAYSYAAVGGKDSHDALAKPLNGVLFFAGEATSGDETGTVAGAIATGHRAAKEILRTT